MALGHGWRCSNDAHFVGFGRIAKRDSSDTTLPTEIARRLRERRARGVAMVAPIEVGEGGIQLLVGNGLLKEHETRDRMAVGLACLAALEEWAEGHGARFDG